jgi:filamentous hemagglutinin
LPYDGRALSLKSPLDEGKQARTYNFEVAESHTYFVGRSGAWVHNSGPCDVSGVAKKVSSGAESALQGARLAEYYRQLEKYGGAGSKELQNGRIRFFGELKPATNPGEMAGARLVREWDPSTGAARTWYETLDHAGRVRSVAPKPATGPANHRAFDKDGSYTGRR